MNELPFDRRAYAVAFVGIYGIAALMLLFMFRSDNADRVWAGGSPRPGSAKIDLAADFSTEIASAADFDKYPNRLRPDKGILSEPDDATSAIGEGAAFAPPGNRPFQDTNSSGTDLKRASFVSGRGTQGIGGAIFTVPDVQVPDGGGESGQPVGTPVVIPISVGGTGGPAGTPHVIDSPSPKPPSDPFVPGREPPDPSADLPPPGPANPPAPPTPPAPPGPPISVPEPLTLSLFAAGLAGVAALRRRRKKPA